MSVVVDVMLSLMIVMSPPPNLCNLSVVKLCTLGVFALDVSLVFWIVICMCVVNKHFRIHEFVFNSVYGDLK